MSAERPDDLDRGAANRRAMLGDAWVERSLGQANSLNAEFQSQVTRHAWHDIWGRPGLDSQTRRLLVLGASAVVRHNKAAVGESWLAGVIARRPRMVAAVAQANKAARIVWALLARGGSYDPGRSAQQAVMA